MGSLQKLRTFKYSVSAEIRVENTLCTLKIRVYRAPDHGRYTVHFKRVTGSPQTFHHVYQQAWQFFDLRFPGISAEGSSGGVFLPGDQPPLLPASKDFSDWTSIAIKDCGDVVCDPHDIGNCILTFLATEVTSSIQKLSTFKY